jgi:hypothetical protein
LLRPDPDPPKSSGSATLNFTPLLDLNPKQCSQFLHSFWIIYRKRACELGEETIASVLLSWDERAPPTTTEPVREFLAMQMVVHHPEGARTLPEGAMWVDRDVWQHQLVRMLQNLVLTTIGNKLRQNKTKGAKAASAYELSKGLVNLAASIYRQTLAMGSEQEGTMTQAAAVLCDVTQIVPELDATAAGPTQKRPRLEREDERRGLDLSWRGFMERTVYGADTDLGKIPQVGWSVQKI